MRKRKWFISVVLSMVLIGGIAGGVTVAADDGSGNVDQQNQLTDRCQEPLDRVCAIYQENTGVAIDSEQLGEGSARRAAGVRVPMLPV